MSYLNTAEWAKPQPLETKPYHAETPLEQYDFNFCYPVKELESDAVRLEPFVPSVHAKEAWKTFEGPAGNQIFRFIPFSKPTTYEAFLTSYETRRRSTDWLDYAIIDKHPAGDRLAGTISWLNAFSTQLTAEIGAVFIFPEHHRTHINTHAVSLMLRYAFEDVRMRRVQWRANSLNQASVAAAERFGFTSEGVLKWDRIVPMECEGHAVASDKHGRPDAGPGRHSAQLAIDWESWEAGVAKNIDKLMSRQVLRT